VNGDHSIYRCPEGQHFDIVDLRCKDQVDAVCSTELKFIGIDKVSVVLLNEKAGLTDGDKADDKSIVAFLQNFLRF
jgi:hypothetical protein